MPFKLTTAVPITRSVQQTVQADRVEIIEFNVSRPLEARFGEVTGSITYALIAVQNRESIAVERRTLQLTPRQVRQLLNKPAPSATLLESLEDAVFAALQEIGEIGEGTRDLQSTVKAGAIA